MNQNFWQGRRVLLTGHTGFKGAWTAVLLADLGAEVTGLSLPPENQPNLWSSFTGRLPLREEIVDIRDAAALKAAINRVAPELVLHMAAQAQVTQSYQAPAETFDINVGGTVNLLEALRDESGLRAILVVTSDKVYRNDDRGVPFVETSPLGGSDPYSASKAAAEIVTRSYAESIYRPRNVSVATARGGNVVGGGDFSSNRLVPDVYRAVRSGQPLELRYPDAERPWQHVLDCVGGYLEFLGYLCLDERPDCTALNFGPRDGEDLLSVAQVAEMVGARLGSSHPWVKSLGVFPPEKQVLRLDSSLASAVLGWTPRLSANDALDWTADWYRAFSAGGDPLELVREQIAAFGRGV